MADYKAIKGHTIQTVAGDPGNLAAGLIWYDSVAKKVQGAKLPAGSWASGGNLNTGRSYGAAAGGYTTALMIGGYHLPAGPAPTPVDVVESYNGTSWTEVADLSTATRRLQGFGTATAALAAGGLAPSATTSVEEFNGTGWAEGGDLPAARSAAGGFGLQTAGLVFGGPPSLVTSQEYNGTAWTDGGNMNTVRQDYCAGAVGAQTDGLAAGGHDGSAVTVNVEAYDGSSWTEGANLNVADTQGAGGGTSTSAILAGGQIAPQATTEEWNGTSWAEVADISVARYGTQGAGSNPSVSTGSENAVLIGGYTSPLLNRVHTEEWTHATAAVTFTSS